jgi:hypothetical protein
MRHLFPALLGIAIFLASSYAYSANWLTAPSYYTHDPQSGERVQQYTPIGPFYVQHQNAVVRSGFRHTRSSLQVGRSADHLHIVEQWGPPVQPYGEWRFPYRPYSVPYGLWGPPFAGTGWGGGGAFVDPFGPGAVRPWPRGTGDPDADLRLHHQRHPRTPRSPYPYPGYTDHRPWHDGNYQPDRTPRLPDPLFFYPRMHRPHHDPPEDEDDDD